MEPGVHPPALGRAGLGGGGGEDAAAGAEAAIERGGPAGEGGGGEQPVAQVGLELGVEVNPEEGEHRGDHADGGAPDGEAGVPGFGVVHESAPVEEEGAKSQRDRETGRRADTETRRLGEERRPWSSLSPCPLVPLSRCLLVSWISHPSGPHGGGDGSPCGPGRGGATRRQGARGYCGTRVDGGSVSSLFINARKKFGICLGQWRNRW